MELTIFTPTYNRCDLLKRTYGSLIRQKCKDFSWLIVDDGSYDGTKEVVSKWISEKIIDIKYVYQKNQGKHIAFNTAVSLIESGLFFTVDSDDWLPENSVQLIKSNEKNLANSTVAGMIALKAFSNCKLISGKFPNEIRYSTLMDLFYQGFSGERSIIYKVEILKKFPFPKTNEKFVPEGCVYDLIDNCYSLFVINDVLTICEYQEDGLSSNPYKLMYNNPTGYKIYYSNRINFARSFKERISYCIRYNCFASLSKDTVNNYHGKWSILVSVSYLGGLFAAVYYRFKSSK